MAAARSSSGTKAPGCPRRRPGAGMQKGHISFELKGHKLAWAWHLVRLKGRPKREARELAADQIRRCRCAPAASDILEEAPESVKSGLSIDDIAAGRSEPERAAATAKETPAARPTAKTAKPRRGSNEMPAFVPPCLARLESTPPAGHEWLHEVKFDGYRMQARLENGTVKLYTRTGLDWTHRFGSAIPAAIAEMPAEQVILDGEIVVLAESGVSVFSELQLALSENRTDRMIYYVFDLLHLDGVDLTQDPLLDRKERLRDLVADLDDQGPVRFSEHFEETGTVMLAHACRMGLEGVVSKRADAPYRSGRGFDWIKSKCTTRQEFVILGYLPSQAAGRGLRSLVVGYWENGELKPAGHVGTGFSGAMSGDLKRKLDALRQERPAVGGAAGAGEGRCLGQNRIWWPKSSSVRGREAVASATHRSKGCAKTSRPAEVVVEKPEAGPESETPAARRRGGKTRSAKAREGAAPAQDIHSAVEPRQEALAGAWLHQDRSARSLRPGLAAARAAAHRPAAGAGAGAGRHRRPALLPEACHARHAQGNRALA